MGAIEMKVDTCLKLVNLSYAVNLLAPVIFDQPKSAFHTFRFYIQDSVTSITLDCHRTVCDSIVDRKG